MSEPRVIRHFEMIFYEGEIPKGAPDHRIVECVEKAEYDKLKEILDHLLAANESRMDGYTLIAHIDTQMKKYRALRDGKTEAT